jgi:hypothetical protein
MINAQSTGDEVRTALYQFYGLQNNTQGKKMQTILEESYCEFDFVTDDFRGTKSYNVRLFVSPDSCASKLKLSATIKDALVDVIHDGDRDNVEIAIKPLMPQEQRPTGINNCSFKQDLTILHDELRFRSRSEVVIYDELKQRDVLFFPNSTAILGASASEYGAAVKKLEPDFLICLKGKWGILEINGDFHHSGIAKTTKDHERARRFQHSGVFFIQAYDGDKCKSDPVGVVDEFLKLLSNHK